MAEPCVYCDARMGTHAFKEEHVEGRSGGDGQLEIRRVTYVFWVCGECAHNEAWALAQRLSFVRGQGWTI